jgi:hypothetical protein
VPALHAPVIDRAIDALDLSPAARRKATRELRDQAEALRYRIRQDRAEARKRQAGPSMTYWRLAVASVPTVARAVRAAGGYRHSWPVRVIVGDDAPELAGDGYGWRWAGRFKSAPGSYQHSTHRVEVGRRWLVAHYAEAARAYREARGLRPVTWADVPRLMRAACRAAIARRHPEVAQMPDAILADWLEDRGRWAAAARFRG